MNINAPTSSQIPALQSLWQEAFCDTEEFLDAFGQTAFSTDRCRCATIDGEIVAALYWFDCLHMGKPVAYLYAIATARKYRRQGICHKLMEDTHRHLSKLGYEGTILVPGSKTLFRFYENMGYRTCSYMREFTCTATDDTFADANNIIPLRSIDKTEYVKLRRRFLPEDGVIQENENLDFLQTQEQFFAGPGFLLAAHGEDDTLYGVELLGDETAAPEIVKILGYKKGTFRVPGKKTPFAMYLSLGDSKLLPPNYFGLAFDI